MRGNKKIFLSVISVLLIVGIGIFWLLIRPSNEEKDNINYTLTYFDDGIPGSKSEINIYDDKVEIIKTGFCSAVECLEGEKEPKPQKEEFNYSEENMAKLVKFISANFANNTEIHDKDLSEHQKEVITGLLISENFFEVNVEDYKYKMEYSQTDSLTYDVYFKEDGSILVKKLNINDDYDIVKIATYSLNFSQDNLNILNEYIVSEIKKENSNIIYKSSTLKKDEINIIKSITQNNASYLENIDNEAKLLYTISYNGLNCMSPVLYLYSDNTYEYYYTFGSSNEKLIPKTGTYDYDVNSIINNIDKYEENLFGPYYIKDAKGNNYTTYNSNIELQELLSSIGVTLEKCLEQQANN